MPKHNLIQNIIALVFVQFANYISPLLVLPYLSRVLGLDGFGTIAMAMSLCSIALVITDYGFALSAPYWISKNKLDKSAVSSYLGAIFFIKTILFIICGSLFFIYLAVNDSISKYGFIKYYIVASIFFQSFQPNWFFLGIEKMKNVTIFMVTAKMTYLIMVFWLVKKSTQVDLVILCFAISNLLATLIGFFYLYKEKYWISIPTPTLVWRVAKDSSPFFISRLAVGVYTSASTFLVGNFAGTSAAALYGSAEKLYQAGQSISSPVSQALFPYLARTGDNRALYKFVGILFVPITFGVILSINYSDLIMEVFFGKDFGAASGLLNIFLVTLLVNFIGVNFGYPAFASIGRVDIANKSVLFAAAFQMLLLVGMFLSNSIDAKNICLSVLFVESVVMLVRVYYFFYLSKRVC